MVWFAAASTQKPQCDNARFLSFTSYKQLKFFLHNLFIFGFIKKNKNEVCCIRF